VGVPDGPGFATALPAKVTAPTRASALPFNTAPVFSVMLACARIVPLKLVDVPRVAELPTCQNTLEACAPPIRLTTLFVAAVVSVLPIWKINTAFEFPFPFNVTVPVMPKEDAVV
jgi:hypothetical protein